MKIKLYRHTIKHTEVISSDDEITYYNQTNWQSVKAYIPKRGSKIVKIEEKEIEVDDENSSKS